MKLHRESVETGFLAGILLANIILGLVAFTGIGPKWLVDFLDKMGRA